MLVDVKTLSGAHLMMMFWRLLVMTATSK